MTKITVKREVLHQLGRMHSGQGAEPMRPDSERQATAYFARALAAATAVRGARVELEVVE